MGKYRATLNIPEAKRFAIAEFPDDDPRVIRMVLDGHLQPVDISDEARERIDRASTTPQASPSSVDAVKQALAAARERAAASSVDEVSTIQTAISSEPAEEVEPKVEDPKDPPSKRQPSKARTPQGRTTPRGGDKTQRGS